MQFHQWAQAVDYSCECVRFKVIRFSYWLFLGVGVNNTRAAVYSFDLNITTYHNISPLECDLAQNLNLQAQHIPMLFT